MTAIETPELLLAADTWTVDPERSSVGFRIKQRLIETVWGRFHDFDGVIESGEAPKFAGAIRVTSVATGHPARDEQLRSADFFDATRYPEMRFVSSNVGLGDGGVLLLTGDLTIKDITRPVALSGAFAGTSVDLDGRERIGIDLRGELNRDDFGLSWNRLLETGGMWIGNHVELVLDLVAERVVLERAA
jgi:polyisoprenoid-binding protein YceI